MQLKYRSLQVLTVLALYPSICGFVLLSSKKARLPVSPAAPLLNFVWDGKAPNIEEKDKYRGGAYADLSNEQFMQQLLNDAMNIWNDVPAAYVQLGIEDQTTSGLVATLNKNDKQFSIVTEHSDNISTAAFAAPNIPDDSDIIDDCDISISDKSTPAKDLAYTITHELGHCLGLGHAHSNYNAIMGYSRMRRNLALGADDMAGIIYLYPDPAESDGQVKEMIGSCGSIRGSASRSSNVYALAAALCLPLTAVLIHLKRRPRPVPATRAKTPQ